MSANSGAWGVVLYKDGYSTAGGLQVQEQGISLEGGDQVLPFLPTVPVGSLLLPPAGLGVPAVRNGDVAFAQRDGVVQFADYYEPRQITLQVLVQNDGCPGCSTEMSARQKVSRLTQEWSRNCSGATLVLFTDCHNPDATQEEKVYNGPYLVHGRPRVADVVWERSNRGVARVTLRFDAADARLILLDALGPDFVWDSDHVQTLDADEQNMLPDPELDGLTMTEQGATVSDSYPLTGGPLGGDGGPYFSRLVETLPVSSPMAMALSPSGTGAVPVDPGDILSIAWWARKDPAGGIPQTRVDWTWYDAAGANISSHNGAGQVVSADWQRFMQENIVAPALAEFVQFRLIWTGIPGTPGYRIDLAQAWLNEGATATAPETVEIVGTLCACPVITLFPELTAPIVVTYGGHEFTYTEDVPIGTVVEIDTRWGRAADGFVDVTQNLEGDFTSCLEPGVHEVTVQTGDPSDTGFVNITWENAVVSG
jgi:hypothetical protein